MNYVNEFMKYLIQNSDFKKQIKALEAILGKFSWELLPLKKSTAKAKKEFYYFNSRGNKKGFSLTLKLGNQLYGFFIARNLKTHIPDEVFPIFRASFETLLREVQKELELQKLYETIRPRAMALSTIHTVHRLVSTTQNTDELIAKMSRLCLQMMRSNKCSISMLDEHGRLIKKAAVDSGQSFSASKKPHKPTGIEDRIVKTGASILSPKRLLVPLVDEDVIGIIKVVEKVGGRAFTEFDKEILTTFAEQAVVALKNTKLYEEQKKMILGSIKSLTSILDTPRPYDYKPSGVFMKLVQELSEELKISEEQKEQIQYAAFLHDAGKVSLPHQILKKRRRLTGKEFKVVKTHVVKGVEIVKPLDALKPAIPIILHHHEKFDGTGYPKGLKAKQIPLGARIMAVADAFVAMISKRPYRPPLPVYKAVSEIAKNSGTQFDPQVVSAFMRLHKSGKFKNILKEKNP